VKEAEGGKEERDRLLAEIMFLTKSFDELQAELTTNAQMYEDCIQSFEQDAAEKDKRIQDLNDELNIANTKIGQLESHIEELTAELERERSVNANLTATVSDLQKELDMAQTNANGYDDIVAILQKEAATYQSQLSESNDQTEVYKQKKIDLEELLSKTRDSLVDEKKRVYDALEEKDARIAHLDQELAEKLNDIHSSKATNDKTTVQLKKMRNNYNSENIRADALDRKIQKLNQFSANMDDAGSSKEEVDQLTQLLEDVSKSNDEYKSLVTTYQDKSNFLSQQLLLSGQNVSRKQHLIASLQEELSDAVTNAVATAEDQQSTSDEVSHLKTKLNEVQSKSTVWKAQANGMIVELTSKLREKDASALELQNKLDLAEQQQPQSGADNEALEKEIAQLKTAMEDAQRKAKEKMKQKNQSLKEMEDTVASLIAEMKDLQREKEQIANRLEGELQRGKEDYQSHDRQIHRSEERLAKEHLVAMTEMEEDMKETIHQLEMEIQSLKTKEESGEAAATVKSTQNDYVKVGAMEEALRRSKEKEVSLINQNMKMQHKLQDLQLQSEERRSAVTSVDDDDNYDDSNEKSVELPTYYKEKQRPVVIRFVGNTWKRLFRRKKLR